MTLEQVDEICENRLPQQEMDAWFPVVLGIGADLCGYHELSRECFRQMQSISVDKIFREASLKKVGYVLLAGMLSTAAGSADIEYLDKARTILFHLEKKGCQPGTKEETLLRLARYTEYNIQVDMYMALSDDRIKEQEDCDIPKEFEEPDSQEFFWRTAFAVKFFRFVRHKLLKPHEIPEMVEKYQDLMQVACFCDTNAVCQQRRALAHIEMASHILGLKLPRNRLYLVKYDDLYFDEAPLENPSEAGNTIDHHPRPTQKSKDYRLIVPPQALQQISPSSLSIVHWKHTTQGPVDLAHIMEDEQSSSNRTDSLESKNRETTPHSSAQPEPMVGNPFLFYGFAHNKHFVPHQSNEKGELIV
ncbi:hypothetical protein BX600DRAFT_440122 [Xylariales sp. PMI_506]|nr:hypothetical protein BX600DRAFT_440122 [Xylariales sp. PMI_506]